GLLASGNWEDTLRFSELIPIRGMACRLIARSDTNSRVRIFLGLLALVHVAWAFQTSPPAAAPAILQDVTHLSQVFDAPRAYQAVLPPAYRTLQKRYPVIYWFHGYEHPSEEISSQIGAYVAARDVIVVRVGPADTVGQFPLYFPELADHVDKTFRTIAD